MTGRQRSRQTADPWAKRGTTLHWVNYRRRWGRALQGGLAGHRVPARGAFARTVWSAAIRARLTTRRLPGIAAVPGGPRPQRDVRVPGKKATPEQSPADGVLIAVSGRADDAEPASRAGRPYCAAPTRRITTVTGETPHNGVVARGKARQGVAMHHGRMCGRRDENGLMGH